jgi:hypothetical protein
MRVPVPRRTAITLAAAALVASAGCTGHGSSGYVGLAPSAASPWKIVGLVGSPGGGTQMQDIWATGPRDAWVIAQACFACRPGSARLVVEHWDGASWRPLPAMPRPAPTAQNAFVGASSATDAWVLAEFDRGADALHWDGRRWTVFRALGCGQVFPAVFGPDDAWAFSDGTRACAARFDGHAWRTVPMPGVPAAVSAVSRSDIWAIGSARASGPASAAPAKTQSVAVAMHWNGRSWHVIRYPNLPAVASHTLTGGTIVATGPRDLWVENGIQADGTNTSTELMLHWDGKNWHRVFVPLAPNGVWSMARDGRGGLWLTAEGSGPTGINWYFYHLHGGLLTLVAAPARRGSDQLYDAGRVAWIPGTTSLWGIETLSSRAKGSQGAIFRLSG